MSRWRHDRTGTARERSRASNGSRVAPSGGHLSSEQNAMRVRARLQELGPQYSCLALYLSSRIDLLPAEYCREFALTPDVASPLPQAQVESILQQELGKHFENIFSEFDYIPLESTLVSQSHRGRLSTGMSVTVVVLRPLFYPIQSGQESVMAAGEIEDLCGDLLSPAMLDDFRTTLRRKINLALSREGMELMAQDAASFEVLRSHKTYPELSTSRLLTFEPADEQVLENLAERRVRPLDVVARRLCHVWLEMALHGHCFPVDPQLHNIFIDQDNHISFLNCDLVGLSSNARENLLNYLDAFLMEDPDKAAMYLLREMVPTRSGRKVDIESFRSSFRQAAYFGALEPVLGTNSNSFAQIVFQHWKTALEHGYGPKTHLLCFYRGLFSIARIARQLTPSGDPLREGMEEFRSTSAFDQIRSVMDWRYWFQNSDKFAAALIHLPRTFDDALTRGSSARLDNFLQERTGRQHVRHDGTAANLLILLLLLVVFAQLPETNGWLGKATPLVLMLVGLLLLRGSPD